MNIASNTENVLGFYRPYGNLENFREDYTFTIKREQLIRHLNTALRLPPKEDKPTPIITNINNETTKNETSSNKNETISRNKVSR